MVGNISLNNQSPSFAGKKFVQMKLLNETFLVPKAVANVRSSVKYVFVEDTNNCYMSNAVNLRDRMFIGIAHFWDCLKKVSEISIGKITCNKNGENSCSVNTVKKNLKNKRLDLGLFDVEMPKKWQIAKSKPVKIGRNLPKVGEDIYIVGYHPEFIGPKVIPAKYRGLCRSSIANNDEYGASASYFEIVSDILKDKMNPSCLSGAAIVNKGGELIGIQGKAVLDNDNSNGILFGISLDTVKKYFKEVNISNLAV